MKFLRAPIFIEHLRWVLLNLSVNVFPNNSEKIPQIFKETYFNKTTLKKDFFTGVSCEFYEISKKTFFHRTPPVAASVINSCKQTKALYTK